MFVTTTDSSDILLSLASLTLLIELIYHLDFPVYIFQLETDSSNITHKKNGRFVS